ncbi:MAG TPA: RidA family protein [Dehalococcoidia bacterium]|nr:RidA family protein [Dehalococcoidia bacterium]
MGIAEKLAAMGLTLPPRRSVGSYVPGVQTGDLLFVSGGGPMKPDGTFVTGKVGGDVTLEDGQYAARLCALYNLASAQEALGDLDRIRRVVKLLGFVNSAPGFVQQHVVMNGASDLLIELLGENGRHARSAVGMAELPMNIAVEVEMVVEVA